jgi:hypothetical protein
MDALKHTPGHAWGVMYPHLIATTGLSGVLQLEKKFDTLLNYGAPRLLDGLPVFSLDVRPALVCFCSLSMRVRAATLLK